MPSVEDAYAIQKVLRAVLRFRYKVTVHRNGYLGQALSHPLEGLLAGANLRIGQMLAI